MPTKILSLDGGGSWALIQAKVLGDLFGPDTAGPAILNHYDYAVANSGGSIVLAGLAAGMTPGALYDLFTTTAKRETIFVKTWHPSTLLTPLGVGVKYSTQKKLAGLRQVLPHADVSLDRLPSLTGFNTRLLIATFDYDRRRAEFFRSHPTSPNDVQPTVAEAVHASSNAPIKYFDEPATFATPAFAGRRFWDGGVGGFNNPMLAGLTQALTDDLNLTPRDLRILSIGTANVYLPLHKPMLVPGASGQNPLETPIDPATFLADIKIMATSILDDPPDQASYIAHILTDGRVSANPVQPITNGNVVRLNPWIQPKLDLVTKQWTTPDIKVGDPYAGSTKEKIFAALMNFDMDAVDADQVALIEGLCAAWIADEVPNQSIRATDLLEPLIGHDLYSKAVAQARALGLV